MDRDDSATPRLWFVFCVRDKRWVQIATSGRFCGVLGFSRLEAVFGEGMLYYSPSVDTVGVFARSCAWMEVAASVLCSDPSESETADRGYSRRALSAQASSEALTLFEGQVDRLQRAGWTVRRVPLRAILSKR